MYDKSDNTKVLNVKGSEKPDDFEIDLLTRVVVKFLSQHKTIDREQLTKLLTELHDAADTPRSERAKIRAVLRGLKIRFRTH